MEKGLTVGITLAHILRVLNITEESHSTNSNKLIYFFQVDKF